MHQRHLLLSFFVVCSLLQLGLAPVVAQDINMGSIVFEKDTSCGGDEVLPPAGGTGDGDHDHHDSTTHVHSHSVEQAYGIPSFLQGLLTALSLASSGAASGLGSAGSSTFDFFKMQGVKIAVKKFLGDLTLDPEVAARVQKHINSSQFATELVPFLFALKDLYAPGTSYSNPIFEEHIKSFYHPQDLPGLEHTLLNWKEKEKGGFNLSPVHIAAVVSLYDALYLGEDGKKLGDEPIRDSKVIAKTKPILRKIIEASIGSVDSDNAAQDVISGVKLMLKDDALLETATISLVDFITSMLHKYFQMFQDKKIKVEQRQKQMLEQLQKDDGAALWAETKQKVQDNRFTVHVLVDGLQGSLLRGLSNSGKAHNFFLEKALDEHKNKTQFKPQTEEVKETPEQSVKFLEHLVENGYEHEEYLPFFKKLYQAPSASDTLQKSLVVNTGISTTPTISVRNLPIAQTGAPMTGEGAINLPNFHFVDRVPTTGDHVSADIQKERYYYFYGNDALLLKAITKSGGMQTIFERLGNKGMNCWGSYDEGAEYKFEGFLNLGVGENDRDFGEKICMRELERRAENEKKLKELREELLEIEETLTAKDGPFLLSFSKLVERRHAEGLIEQIAQLEAESMPAYLHYYLPWPDHFAHFKGPFSDEVIAPTGELNRLDYWLRQLEAIYQKAGINEKTLYGMSGDHGLAPVYYALNPELALQEKLKKDYGIELSVLKISSDEGEGPKINNPLHPPSARGLDMVVASTAGGDVMFDFFIDQEDKWKQQPLYSDLLNLKTLKGETINMMAAITDTFKESLEYMAVRQTPFTAEGGQVRLLATDSEGKAIDAIVTRNGNKYFYQTLSGHDPLQVHTLNKYRQEDEHGDLDLYKSLLEKCIQTAQVEDQSTWCDDKEWAILTSFTNKPDSVVQIAKLYDSARAGTVNLFPRDGIGYNTIVPGRHAGEHFHEKDAFVGFWGEPLQVAAATSVPTAGIGSVPITLLEYQTGEKMEVGKDGVAYPSLLPDLLKR